MAGPAYSNDDYTIGIICTSEIESAAVQGLLDEEHPDLPRTVEEDTNTYVFGKIFDHNIVIASPPSGPTDTNAIAVLAMHLLRSFEKIRFGIMVGVGGGIPAAPSADPRKDIHLGDVVVSTPSGNSDGWIQYDLESAIQAKKPSDLRRFSRIIGAELGLRRHNNHLPETFYRTGSSNRLPALLRNSIETLRARAHLERNRIEHYLEELLTKFPDSSFHHPNSHADTMDCTDQLFSSKYIHEEGQPDCQRCKQSKIIKRRQRARHYPVVHYGHIGSGNQDIKDANLRDQLRKKENIICYEVGATGLMNNFPGLVVRGISHYCDSHRNDVWQPWAAAAAAAFTKDLLSIIQPLAVSNMQTAVLEIQAHTEVIVQQIGEATNDIDTKAIGSGTKSNLIGLPYARGAAFNSYVDEDNLETTCMPETRIDILRTIMSWVLSHDSQCIFWLNGMAGTGKSTIARTVAMELNNKGLLGASFFFKRGDGDRGRSLLFFPTIASQLSKAYPSLRSHVARALEENPHIAEQSLEEQFELLISKPLKAIAQDFQNPVALVIDALDECEPESRVIRLIELLAELASIRGLYIRIFLTSRPDLAPREGFRNLTTINYQDIILHDIAPEIIRQDIELYLRVRLSHIRTQRKDSLSPDWPGEVRIESLITTSTPLFSYAATICRFLGEMSQDPNERMLLLMQNCDLEVYKDIYSMYRLILDRLPIEATTGEQNGLFQDFQTIVGAIVTLAEPLSISDLAAFLNIDENRMKIRLGRLHSVLRISKNETLPVQILHKSFRDFLLDRNMHKDSRFWIEEEAAHRMLANNCLDWLNHVLQGNEPNIQGLGTAYVKTHQDKNQLPSHFRYACRYWVHHFCHSGNSCTDSDMDRVLEFLQTRYISFVKALTLCGHGSDLTDMMNTLQSLGYRKGNIALQTLSRTHLLNCFRRLGDPDDEDDEDNEDDKDDKDDENRRAFWRIASKSETFPQTNSVLSNFGSLLRHTSKRQP